MKKIFRAILEISKKTQHFSTLHQSPHNPRLGIFSEKPLCDFSYVMLYYPRAKIKKILRAD